VVSDNVFEQWTLFVGLSRDISKIRPKEIIHTMLGDDRRIYDDETYLLQLNG